MGRFRLRADMTQLNVAIDSSINKLGHVGPYVEVDGRLVMSHLSGP